LKCRTAKLSVPLIVMLSIMSTPGLADSLVVDGHVNGPHTRLELTKEQSVALDQGAHQITLSSSQHNVLAGLPGADSVAMLVVEPASHEGCTCEDANVAVRINTSTIEVADEFLGRDLIKESTYQPQWIKRNEDQWKAQEEETNIAHPAEEAVLNSEGQKLIGKSPLQAVQCFQKALEVNPKHKWSRKNLALTYYMIGNNAMYGKTDYGKAVQYLQLAVQTVDPDDTMWLEDLSRELQIARFHLNNPTR